MHLASTMARIEVGSYWHLLPKHVQARRAIWTGIDHVTGRRFLERFFPDAVSVNNTEMFVETEAGSSWQLLGSDNYDRMVGSNPRGVVFSEWALCDPRAWDYIRPILRANKGWAIFISTFRGRNHAYQMYQTLKNNPEWFVTLKTVDDTNIVTAADVQADRDTGMSERLIQQEYYCKPAPPATLGPYARVLDSLEQVGNVRDCPDSALHGAVRHLALGQFEDYTAMLECASRGDNHYILGGSVDRNVAIHEVLATRLQALVAGTVDVVAGEELDDDLLRGLNVPISRRRVASKVETASFLERSIVSPTSILTSALTGSLDVRLDEEANIEEATGAVYAALERLAGSARVSRGWHAPPSYAMHDRAVIGNRP